MKNITTILFLFLHLNLIAQKDSATVKNILLLSSKVERLELIQDKSIAIISTANESIANMLTCGGVFLTLIGIGISIYITSMQNRASKNLQSSKEILMKIEEQKNEILRIEESIKNNPSKLYRQLKEEELLNTIHLMKTKPYTIHYAYAKLQTENISQTYFTDFRDIFREKYGEDNSFDAGTESGLVFLLCIKNFPSKCINDQYIKSIIEEHFKEIFDNIGEEQLLGCAKELVKKSNQKGFEEYSTLVTVFCENIGLFTEKKEIKELCEKL